jgi:hypothetical protein
MPDPEVYRVIADWHEFRIKTGLHQEFRAKATRIVIRKPDWMPERLYRWLMGTIVLEEREERAPLAPRRERRNLRRGIR